MMLGVSWVVMASVTGVDLMVNTETNGVSIRAPATWKQTATADERSWFSQDGAANCSLSVYVQDPPDTAEVCLEKIKAAVTRDEKDGRQWTEVQLGKGKALRKVSSALLSEDGGTAAAEKVTSVQYVGCNGKRRWALSFDYKATLAAKYGILVKRMAESLTYKK